MVSWLPVPEFWRFLQKSRRCCSCFTDFGSSSIKFIFFISFARFFSFVSLPVTDLSAKDRYGTPRNRAKNTNKNTNNEKRKNREKINSNSIDFFEKWTKNILRLEKKEYFSYFFLTLNWIDLLLWEICRIISRRTQISFKWKTLPDKQTNDSNFPIFRI